MQHLLAKGFPPAFYPFPQHSMEMRILIFFLAFHVVERSFAVVAYHPSEASALLPTAYEYNSHDLDHQIRMQTVGFRFASLLRFPQSEARIWLQMKLVLLCICRPPGQKVAAPPQEQVFGATALNEEGPQTCV